MPGPALEADLQKYAVGTGVFSAFARNWKTRRFRLTDTGSFSYADGASVKRTIQLAPGSGVSVVGHPTKATNAAVRDEARSFVVRFSVNGKTEHLLVEAPDAITRDAWVAAIDAHLAPASPLATTATVPPASVVEKSTATASSDPAPSASAAPVTEPKTAPGPGPSSQAFVEVSSEQVASASTAPWSESAAAARALFGCDSIGRGIPRRRKYHHVAGVADVSDGASTCGGVDLFSIDASSCTDAIALRWTGASGGQRIPMRLTVKSLTEDGAGTWAPVLAVATPYAVTASALDIAVPPFRVADDYSDEDAGDGSDEVQLTTSSTRECQISVPSTGVEGRICALLTVHVTSATPLKMTLSVAPEHETVARASFSITTLAVPSDARLSSFSVFDANSLG